MKDLDIKIAGSGIREEIIHSLESIIESLNDIDENEIENGFSFEDGCLYLELK